MFSLLCFFFGFVFEFDSWCALIAHARVVRTGVVLREEGAPDIHACMWAEHGLVEWLRGRVRLYPPNARGDLYCCLKKAHDGPKCGPVGGSYNGVMMGPNVPPSY